MDRRTFLLGASAASASLGLAGCIETDLSAGRWNRLAQLPSVPIDPLISAEPPIAVESQDLPPITAPRVAEGDSLSPSLIYGPVTNEPFPVPAVKLANIGPSFLRRTVDYVSSEPAGTVIIDPSAHYLYLIEPEGRARRYGVGVGREGFGWSGVATINSKQEWPDWYPPKEMLERQPELKKEMGQLQSGIGMPGGPHNPLGARAMYLWQNNKDTLYRIHGTVEPWTIGKNVSSGCIRMINQDAIDLYQRAPLGTKVRVLALV
jgi:lipoprotein-anchoring transpeptidase ErfK/SrfK